MEVSAEIRWFWQGTGPANLQAWFTGREFHDCTAGGGNRRQDAYLCDPQQAELGIKLRGNKPGVEVKGLVASVVADGCRDHPFGGPIEIWSKWPSVALSLAAAQVIPVNKRRWLRTFDNVGAEVREIALDAQERPVNEHELPDEGGNVEYTEISVAGLPPWATFGFEAFGSLQTVIGNLRRLTAQMSRRSPPALTHGWCASYPAWLQRLAAQSRQ
jgi:hypothetical protein